MPTTVDVTQVQPTTIQDSPVAPAQISVEQIPPVEFIPLHVMGNSQTKFFKYLGPVYTDIILFAEHGLSAIIGIYILKPTGEEVSVMWMVSGTTVYIFSNINLNNHKLIIF